MELFAKAIKAKLRFTHEKGLLSIEDLWALNLNNLNTIAVQLNKEIQAHEISFISPTQSADEIRQLKFDVVKYIIDYQLKLQEERKLQAEKLAKKQQLLELLNEKETESLKALTAEEIKKQLAELER